MTFYALGSLVALAMDRNTVALSTCKRAIVNHHPYKIEVVLDGRRRYSRYLWSVMDGSDHPTFHEMGTARSIVSALSQAWREIGERELILG